MQMPVGLRLLPLSKWTTGELLQLPELHPSPGKRAGPAEWRPHLTGYVLLFASHLVYLLISLLVCGFGSFNMLGSGSGTIERCGLVGGSVSL